MQRRAEIDPRRRRRRRARSALTASILIAWALASSVTQAGAPGKRVHVALDYSAPRGCPQPEDAQQQLDKLLGAAGVSDLVWARVVLSRAPRGWLAHLDVQVGPDRRDEYLYRETCEDASRVALSIVARSALQGADPVPPAAPRAEAPAAPAPPPASPPASSPPPATPHPVAPVVPPAPAAQQPAAEAVTPEPAGPPTPREEAAASHAPRALPTTRAVLESNDAEKLAPAPSPRAKARPRPPKASTPSAGSFRGDRLTVGVALGRPDIIGLGLSARLSGVQFDFGLGFISETMAGVRGLAGFAVPIHDGRAGGRGLRLDLPLMIGLFKCIKAYGPADFTALEVTGGLELGAWFSQHFGLSVRFDIGFDYVMSASPSWSPYAYYLQQDDMPFAEEGTPYPLARLSVGVSF